jgi:ribosomal protein L11 methyltransferase
MKREVLKEWLAVDVLVDSDATEAVESAFNTLGALGTEIVTPVKAKGGPQMVTGYFNASPVEADVRVAVNESLRIYGITEDAVISIASRTVEERDWLAEWKRHWQPSVVGPFMIAPPWSAVDESDKVVIRVEPNMAFGTGTHETTQLCLRAIADNYRAGQSFLDIGTGTGILAIAAAQLATENTENTEKPDKGVFFACDTDAASIRIARENAAANSVDVLIEFVHGTITDDLPRFDFVCANLTLDVITSLLSLLLAKTRETLVLSGILAEQKELIDAELKKFQISDLEFRIAGEWIAVIISMD